MINFKKIIWGVIPFLLSASFAQTTHTFTVETKLKKIPFGLTETVASAIPEVAVALSGGGARGLAQIGVMRALTEAGIPINIIAGTSMGSIVGGLYASGYSLNEMDSIAAFTDWDNLLASDRETNRRELFVDQKITEDKAIFSLRLKGLKPILPTSLNSGQKISTYLNLLALQAPIHVDSSFDELISEYRAVCTNLVTGQPVILGRGSLSEAMRASSSVSFFLSPVTLDSLTLVDGGLVENIPVNVAKKLGGDYIIAVNTTSPLHPVQDLNLPWIIADQVVSIPMKKLDERELKNANIIITPDLDNIAISDFSDVNDLIKKGYDAAHPLVKEIKTQIDSMFIKNLNQKVFYIKNILVQPDEPGYEAEYIKKYSAQDSVSSTEILEDLYSLFSKGIYEDLKVEIKDYGNYSTVNFIAKANQLVKGIKINGVTLLDKNNVSLIYSSILNKPFDAQKVVQKTIDAIELYRKEGYALAMVNKIRFDKNTGELSVWFDEGRISEITIDGNEYTSRTVITREIPLKEGDFFNTSSLKQALINLRSTNLFDDIFINIKRIKNKNILELQVKEKPSSLLRMGFRIDNEKKAQLSMDFVDENLFGSGTEFGFLLAASSRSRGISIEHKSNRMFDTYFTYKLNAFYRLEDVLTYADLPSTSTTKFSRGQTGEYREIYYGGTLSLGTQVQRFGNLIFVGKYQFDEVKSLQNEIVNPYRIKIVSLGVNTTIDTQDKYPYPQKGFYFNGGYESAQTVLGGDVGFTKLAFEYKSYFTFVNSNTISPRLIMGFADKTLPLSEQFSLGGQNSFFGMRENEFRGRQIFLASLEYRYQLPFKIFFDTYLELRYDLGSVWKEQEEIRFKDLKHGIGGTVSFDTPIGPASFSVGKSFLFVKNLPGNPLSFGDTYFYFSIGYYY